MPASPSHPAGPEQWDGQPIRRAGGVPCTSRPSRHNLSQPATSIAWLEWDGEKFIPSTSPSDAANETTAFERLQDYHSRLSGIPCRRRRGRGPQPNGIDQGGQA